MSEIKMGRMKKVQEGKKVVRSYGRKIEGEKKT